MSYRFLLTVISFGLFTFTAFAEPEKKQVYAEYTSLSTSDEVALETYSLGFANPRRNLSYPYPDEAMTSLDYQIKYSNYRGTVDSKPITADKVKIEFAQKFSSQLLASAGLNFIQYRENDQDDSLLSPHLNFQYRSERGDYLALQLERGYLFQTGSSSGSSEALHYSRAQLGATLKTGERFRIINRTSLSYISDGNRKSQTDLSALYGLSLWPQWIWVGLGAEYLSHTEQRTYWSPSLFYSYGLRSEFSIPFDDFLFLNMGLNLNQIHEQEVGNGTGHYYSAGIQIGSREDNHLRFDLFDLDSSLVGSRWNSSGGKLILNLFF